ncbi:type 2 lantipeptide synthetase LanM, partial [Enterococcus faecalis]|nr:type 2 lantipeptide synthetase LanM [Enterococcus faecalis]
MNCFDKGKALTIEERMSLIKNKIFDDKNSSNIQRWLNRKTTVDSELFSKILNINNWKLEEFNHCIDENFKIDSYSDRVTYSDFDSLIASIEDQNNLPSTYVKLIRPFLTKLENGLIVDFQDKLSEKAIENIFDCLASRLINLSLKVFVLEMDFIKNSNGLHGETSKERFINFIDLYDDKEKLLNLYQKYPVMTRKLSITTLYFIDFMNEFLNNLFQSWDSIEDTFFDTEEKIYVESLIFEKGDT